MPLKEELIMPSVGSPSTQCVSADRGTWATADAREIYKLPFNDPHFRAPSIHRSNFTLNQVQCSKSLSIKTRGCLEDCGYFSQSARAPTGLGNPRPNGRLVIRERLARSKDHTESDIGK